MACIRRDRDCSVCTVKGKCAYTFLFETGIYFSSREVVDTGGVPRPFELEPPLEDKETYKNGEYISVSLVLIGRGIDYLPYFIATFDRMGEKGIGRNRGKFILARVTDGYIGNIVYDRETGTVNRSITRKTWSDIENEAATMRHIGSCRVYLVTPLRLKRDGRLANFLDFELLVRSVLRRILYLAGYFAEKTFDLDVKRLIARAREVTTTKHEVTWYDWERYSSRHGARMKLGGIIGEIEFKGDLGPFWSLLLMGQEVHIGKNTTFGLGKYVLEPKNKCSF
ncbi:MAG: CRISPR system precrRNA processing endoribonuclease RAMP protein Cas6 [Thermoanaerobacteraceae bacterium]|nr:CRISPR system precrRNA processing endoribonuclease RAMP protein Cas6 [Thermoanaerobacteraceae bacterium]